MLRLCLRVQSQSVVISALIMSVEKTHGGKRAGAGRKKTGRCRDVPHRARPELSGKHPVHVSLRLRVRRSHRNRDVYRIVYLVLTHLLARKDFRVCHVSIQHSHVHMIVEAADRRALSAGMKSFGISFARRYHHKFGGCDNVCEFRYSAKQVTTRRYARHALSYVLNNWRRHRVDWENGEESPWKLDPYSSAISFTGWTERFAPPKDYDPLPVSSPQTGLLISGWQQFGGISPYEVPGPLV
jgi:REP element-mobilizing transposase RayT